MLEANQDDTTHKATYLQINDQPADWDIQALFKLEEKVRSLPDAQRKAAFDAFFKTHPRSNERVYLGTSIGHASLLALEDRKGRPRILVMVGADGKPALQFLDANGKVIEQLLQASKH